jgi:hypothetical protein
VPESLVCQIRVCGHIPPRWAADLGDLQLTYLPDGDALLFGQVSDQAALHGILRRLYDLGVFLVSVHCRERSADPESGAMQ